VIHLGSNGSTDPNFGTKVVAINPVSEVAAMPAGTVFALTSNEFGQQSITKITSTGTATPMTLSPDPNGTVVRPGVRSPIAADDHGLIAFDASGAEAIRRWLPDGTIDTGFAAITLPTVADVVEPQDVEVLPNGGILVLWSTWWDDPSRVQGLLTRYQSDGTLDPTFGSGGSTVTPTQSYSARENRIHVTQTGVIQLISDMKHSDSEPPRLVQLTADGHLDESFGRHGVSDLVGYQRYGVGYSGTAALVSDLIADGDQVFSVWIRASLQPLRPGAGLMLQWNGDAWPTRFGSDPGPECPFNTPYWPDDDNARGITTVNGKGGYVVDLFGGIHRFSFGLQHPRPPKSVGGPYWPGWDITRGIASRPDGTGGYVLDAYGGVHPFRTGANANPAPIVNGPYWPGWNITRGIALLPDGNRGYILDAYGGIHPFTTPGHALPPALNHTPYWPGWDIARGIGVLPDGTGGYVVDAFGGAHPFGIGTHAPPPGPGANAPYAAGEDWVRGYTFIAPKPASSGVSASARGNHPSGAVEPRPATANPRPHDRTPHGPVTKVG
jgi:hypothetical protein